MAHGVGRAKAALRQSAGILAAWGSPDQPIMSCTNPRGTCGHRAGEGICDCPE